ncbi:MAG TPA: bifunctional precorrin-2 dehydrogenase/sirohydrochlorin ferrochelatase [Acidimicrobiales bacterium]|nr:bifunctional precorrin-2 dehydrogenase/sirohydrochlorin ferrochelatase [Acidimicrobiales bacterium]
MPEPTSTRPLRLFHVALRLEGERCLVVGGGAVAARKAGALLEAGARVTVVARSTGPDLEALEAAPTGGRLEVLRRAYRAGEAAALPASAPLEPQACAGERPGYRLVITATGVAEVDREVSLDARRAGILVNAADDPDQCTWIMPSVARCGDVSVAVSTGGASPYGARWVRERLEPLLDESVAEMVALLGRARREIRSARRPTEGLDWEGLAASLWPLVEAGRSSEAADSLSAFVAAAAEAKRP